jgi:hypothetical protein
LAAPVGDRVRRALCRRCGVEREAVMDHVDLSALFLRFLVLWFVAIGGPSAMLSDIHRYVVEVNQWMTSTQFAELYTVAQVGAWAQPYVCHPPRVAARGLGGCSRDHVPSSAAS